MKRLALLLLSLVTCFSFVFGDTKSAETNSTKIVMSDELKAKYKLKPHHEHLAFDCIDCHTNQGDDPSKFKNIKDEGCLSCHGTKKLLAQRLKFMDTLKANPHNSVHDGPTLYCDECHFEHKP
ncbi:cytochrome c3 family protein, partial [Campylobacter sp. RM13119]